MTRRQRLVRYLFWTPITAAGLALWVHGLATFSL